MLVCVGYHNKIPDFMAQPAEIHFLTVLEARKSEIKIRQGSFSGESILPYLQITTSHCVFMWWREKRASSLGVSSYQGTNPIMRDSTFVTSSDFSYFPEPPSSNTIILEMRDSAYKILREHKHLVHSRNQGLGRLYITIRVRVIR